MNLASTFFKQIAENNWEPIVFADLENKVVYANLSAYALYGYDPGELIGLNVDVFNAKVSHDTSHIVQAIIDNGGWSGELVQRRKNDEHFLRI
jgi:PAS domain S-box-containing protein